MSTKVKIVLVLLIALITIQFIRPARNISAIQIKNDFIKQMGVPATVAGMLKTACCDCHSNNTRYPWYANIQPVGWMLANHINDGKMELNFNDYGNYSQRRKLSKLKAIHNSVRDGSMPLPAYTFIHQHAKLSAENKNLILKWTLLAFDSLSKTKRQ